MSKRAVALLSSSLFALTLCNADDITQSSPPQSDQELCGMGPHHIRVGARYTTSKGIGYNKGYTTVEGFFAPESFLNDAWLPFLDIRGHVFNNAKFAANAGLGVRYLKESRVWGANAYYDYRNTSHQHYNQVAAGLESLGHIWDFRINGYLPVGKKESSSSSSGAKYVRFQEHYLYIQSSSHFAMKGANAEAGMHVDHFKNAPFYFAAGPYYLTGKGATTWGGELRARVDFLQNYLRLEGNTSYDHFFKWTGQAQFSINIPLGGHKSVRRNSAKSCSQAMALQMRAAQPVDRFEIIPEGKTKQTSPAINPATGQPWYFWFVNNTSSSDGTYESPYPTLVAAQNSSAPEQVIYVYPGDGTTTGMDAGITLQNDQMMLGASVSHPIITTKGTVTIPPLASSLPNITNSIGSGNVVTLGNNNVVSGFDMLVSTQFGSCITGTSISNPEIDRNVLVTNAIDTNGIELSNPLGQAIISSNYFDGFNDVDFFGSGIWIVMDNTSSLSNLNISGNTIKNIEDSGPFGGCGVFVSLIGGGKITDLNVLSNSFNNFNPNSDGIFLIVPADSEITNINVVGNDFADFNQEASAFNISLTETGIISNINISENTFEDFTTQSWGINSQFSSSAMVTNYTISNNTFKNFSGNSSGLKIEPSPNGGITDFTISSNTFSGINDTSLGIFYSNTSSANTLLEIVNNNFVLGTGTATGYAASISSSAGTMCLNMVNNLAIPASSPAPYGLTQTGGTFNITAGSNSAGNNGGQFVQSGTIGTCTQ